MVGDLRHPAVRMVAVEEKLVIVETHASEFTGCGIGGFSH